MVPFFLSRRSCESGSLKYQLKCSLGEQGSLAEPRRRKESVSSRSVCPDSRQGRSARAGGWTRAQAGHQHSTGGQGQRASLSHVARQPTGTAQAAVLTVTSATSKGELGTETRLLLGSPRPEPRGSRGDEGEPGLRTHAGPSGGCLLELSVVGGTGSQRLPRHLGAQGPVLGMGRHCVLSPRDARPRDEGTEVKGRVALSERDGPEALAAPRPLPCDLGRAAPTSSTGRGVTTPPGLGS